MSPNISHSVSSLPLHFSIEMDEIPPVTVISYPKSQQEIEQERREREAKQAQDSQQMHQQLMFMAQMLPIQAQIEKMNKRQHEANNQPKNSSLTRFEPILTPKPIEPEMIHGKRGKFTNHINLKGKEQSSNHPRSKKHKSNLIGPHKPHNTNQIAAQCISCIMHFKTMKEYAIHMSGHVECKKCDYVAHKTLVRKHMITEHGEQPSTDDESPEDIDAYIAERKKRFPSKSKKSDEIVEKVIDGEEGEIQVSKLTPKRQKELRVCQYFTNKGFCRNGDTCKFLHVDAPKMSMPACLINVQFIN